MTTKALSDVANNWDELKKEISPWKEDILKNSPPWVDKNYADRFMTNLLIAFQKNRKLLDCDTATIRACVLDLSKVGFTVGGVREQACLVPFAEPKKIGNQWIKNLKCQLIIGYKGAIDLIKRDKDVSYVNPDVVYKKDKWKEKGGTAPSLDHDRDSPPNEREEKDILCFYAVIFYKDGRQPIPRVVDKKEVDDAKAFALDKFKNSEYRDKQIAKSPWTTKYVEMGKKTAILRIAKYMAEEQGMDNLLSMEKREPQEEKSPAPPTYDADYISQNSDEYLLAEVEKSIDQ